MDPLEDRTVFCLRAIDTAASDVFSSFLHMTAAIHRVDSSAWLTPGTRLSMRMRR
jgi:hypothetical protein